MIARHQRPGGSPAHAALRRAGDAVAAVSLGGATLGDGEGARILEAACRAGVALVDTSDAYGHSEFVVGLASCGVAVATKYGNPCARNGYAHDWSVAAGRAALDASRAALRGKRLALYQLHSPPADAVTPAVAQVLEAAVTAGEIGGWGASVHSFECGRRCVALGCDALQVPFNVLQQEHAALIDGCRSAGVGVLAQSVLAQGWLTTQGVGVARALLAGRADLLRARSGRAATAARACRSASCCAASPRSAASPTPAARGRRTSRYASPRTRRVSPRR